MDGRSARLHVMALDLALTAAEAARRLAGRDRVTAWSGAWSHGDLVTCDPVRVAGADDDPFALLADVPRMAPDPEHPHAVGGGWFGYLRYAAPGEVPGCALGWYRDVLRHDGRRWWYEALLDASFDAGDARRRCAALLADLRTPAVFPPARLELLRVPDRAAHVVAVERCVQAIRRGEVYQANIATRLDLHLAGSPHDAWARLVEAVAPARAALVADPAGTAVSASPELFLRRRGRAVVTEPIKGTRPRTGVDDERERAVLDASAKDAAENVMIVDLMRNDLSRVCATGTVRVPRLLAVEPHAGVWHLVSTVAGELAAGCDDADLVRAAFPPGSVTGAPKVRAVELIDEFEARPRGLFTGALGYASPLAGLELSVAIRTLEVGPDGQAELGVGGGVTVDSTPALEWAECLTKAAPLLSVLGADVPAAAVPGDPAGAGLFETLLVVDGRPQRLAEHAGRLRRSFWECYGIALHADVGAAVDAAVAGRRGPLRVRVDAEPARPDRVRVAVQPCALPVDPADDAGVVARVVRSAGGGPHKVAERGWADAAERGLADGEAALLVDECDRVLEATRSNVVAVVGDVVRTPPLDGRILPGTARLAVLDALDAAGLPYAIGELTLADLAAAHGVFLTNPIR
ncbi:aminodeoxychorismate synthase component I, partial [Pseudonocardia nigra]|uniref:aminodeoxychorismate synthase component I n=1 Tax=Pseudonocardia nigra TaxID=1921578 RepID=UPI001C5D4EE1